MKTTRYGSLQQTRLALAEGAPVSFAGIAEICRVEGPVFGQETGGLGIMLNIDTGALSLITGDGYTATLLVGDLVVRLLRDRQQLEASTGRPAVGAVPLNLGGEGQDSLVFTPSPEEDFHDLNSRSLALLGSVAAWVEALPEDTPGRAQQALKVASAIQAQHDMAAEWAREALC